MAKTSKRKGILTPFQTFLGFSPVHEILHFYVDLNCAVIGPTLPSKWWTLNRRIRVFSLYELEKRYRQTDSRDRYLRECVHRVQSEKRTLCGEHLGFRDLFVPILRKGKILSFLVVGAFADREMDRDSVLACWDRLSKGAAPTGPEFQEFIRILLEVPVLEKPVLEAYQESLELFAGLLGGEIDPHWVEERTLQLRREVFSRELPHLKFLRWALGFEASESLPTWSVEIEEWDWVRDEIGLNRIPTTVIAVVPKTVDKRPDPLDQALRIYRFQRRCFRFAQTLPQTFGGKLDNYGAVFVTSADHSLTKARQAQQIQATARRIHAFAQRELEGPALVGVGESVPRGEVLENSYRQAVLALHFGGQTGQEIVSQSSIPDKGAKGVLELNRLLSLMTRHLAEASRGDLEVLEEGYLKQVLTLSLQNPVEIRWHFQYALGQLKEAVRSRLPGSDRELNGSIKEAILQLEKASTTRDLVLTFKTSVDRLVEGIGGAARRGTGSVQEAKDYIDGHFQEPIRLARLARMAGVSPSTFSRRFQELTGTGLESYLGDLRLEEAKRLLRTGRLPLGRIAKDCGFRSAAYFSRVFSKRTGMTPFGFRQKFQGD